MGNVCMSVCCTLAGLFKQQHKHAQQGFEGGFSSMRGVCDVPGQNVRLCSCVKLMMLSGFC